LRTLPAAHLQPLAQDIQQTLAVAPDLEQMVTRLELPHSHFLYAHQPLQIQLWNSNPNPELVRQPEQTGIYLLNLGHDLQEDLKPQPRTCLLKQMELVEALWPWMQCPLQLVYFGA
jgi:hypothetical protein